MITDEILAEINRKRRLVSRWPFAAIGWLILFSIVGRRSPEAGAIMLLLWPVVVILVRKQDIKRKTYTLTYADDMARNPSYLQVVDSFRKCAGSQRIYQELSSSAVADKDQRNNAGAGRLVNRTGISLKLAAPKFVSCNVTPPTVLGTPPLYFFPDTILLLKNPRLLVKIPYEQIGLVPGTTRFIESGITYPRDAPVVDHTWQYVNKNGSPDKRKKENKQLPVLMYDTLDLSINGVINRQLMISAPGTAGAFAAAINAYRPSDAHTLLTPATSIAGDPEQGPYGPPRPIPA